MRITRTIATGVFLGWMCQGAAAVPPVIDRPSPPPCCADGQCWASPLTYGYYDTRWRRWPLEATAAQAQTPAGKPGTVPAQLQDEVPPFVVPPAEQEDKKAPPSSVPAGEQVSPSGAGGAPRTQGPPGGSAPQGTQQPVGPGLPGPGAQPRSLPGYPATPGLPTPPQSTVPPGGQGTQPNTAPIYKNVPSGSPLNRGSEADPPPSLPFGPALVAPEKPTRDLSQQPAELPMPSPSVQQEQSPSNDPPPALPVALASYQE